MRNNRSAGPRESVAGRRPTALVRQRRPKDRRHCSTAARSRDVVNRLFRVIRGHRRYSQFTNSEYCLLRELKPQDLLVLLKVAAHLPQRWSYAALGEALAISASEADYLRHMADYDRSSSWLIRPAIYISATNSAWSPAPSPRAKPAKPAKNPSASSLRRRSA